MCVVCNYSMVVGLYVMTCLTAQNMDNCKVTYGKFINKLHVKQIGEFK
jgi:hypothetical protein